MLCKEGGEPVPSKAVHDGARAPVQVLLVDDDGELCAMLAAYLGRFGFAVTRAADGPDGIAAALAQRFDAVILDIMMPTLDGLAVLRQIRRYRDLPVIMLTARGDNADRIAGLEMGADDYVTKPFDPRELVARMRAVLRRNRPAGAGSHLHAGSLALDARARRATCGATPLALTAAEFSLLAVLLHAGGSVKSKDELTLEGLGRPRESYDRSLDVHISKIRQKLAAAACTDVEIETVRGIGYRIRAAH